MQRSRWTHDDGQYCNDDDVVVVVVVAGVCITDVGGEDVLAFLKALWAYR